MMQKRLYRSRRERVIAGVCGGLADYFSMDPTLVRLVWLVLALGGGSGIILYLLAILVIPEEPRLRLDEATASEGAPGGAPDHADGGATAGPTEPRPANKALLGLFLVGLGFFFLVRNLFPFVPFLQARFLWTYLLILVGVVVLVDGFRRRD